MGYFHHQITEDVRATAKSLKFLVLNVQVAQKVRSYKPKEQQQTFTPKRLSITTT
ncbi:MAG: hypothetical protein AAGI69_29315 [Cyanobacteria bacterium P01_H01_bin.21]